MKPIDFKEIDTSDDGYGDFLLDGKLFSGIAYERDSDTSVIVRLSGFLGGKLNGCSRAWSLSGKLEEEAFYRLGTYHGPVRSWDADGSLKSNEYWPRDQHSAVGIPEPVIDIDLDELEFLEHPWGWGKEPAPQPSFDEFRGYKRSEGDNEMYIIEQAKGRDVVHVEAPRIEGRSLLVAYKRRSLRFDDAFASRLIQQKILGDVCLDAYRGRVDQVVFQCIPTKLTETIPYASS